MATGLFRAVSVLIAAMGIHFSSQAAICTTTNIYANPDASVTNATSCGDGNKTNEDVAGNLNSVSPGGFNDWTFVDKAGDGSSNGKLSMTGVGAKLGDWGFNDQLGYDSYLLIIKDGVIPNGGTADAVSWFWFVIDTSAGCTISSFIGTLDYCGTWTMFGEQPGGAKAISHLSLYARDGGTTDDEDDEAPEPASLALVGVALGALALSRRRSRKQ